jgi:hypothetical protein
MGHQYIIAEIDLASKERIGSALGHLAEDLQVLLASDPC